MRKGSWLAGASVALAACVAILLAWLLQGGAEGEPAASEVRVEAPVAPAPDLREAPAAPETSERVELEEPPPVVAGEPTEPPMAYVRGRCVAAESGAPLAGCTVSFSGSPRNSSVMASHGPVDWSDPEPVVTGPDGRFEIAFEPPPPYQHSLNVRCDSRVPRTARWGAFEPGQAEDLGDVALALGHTVAGRVVDMAGAPMPGVRVSLKGLPLPLRDDMAANSTRGGSSDESGLFEVDVPIPAGTWSLDVSRRGLKLVEPDTVTVREALGAGPVTVVVRRMPSISGVVVDETGAGVSRVGLKAELIKRSGRMASARTREDGSFTLYAVDEELYPVRLRVDDPGPCEPPSEPGPEHEWGATGVRIELVRALSFELEVVERASGAPVEEYAVACYAERSRSSLQREPRLGGHHPGGRVTVDRVWRGDSRLVVHPNDPQLASSEPLRFEAQAAPLAPIRVELERMLERRVRVTSAGAEPVPGSLIEVVRLGSRSFSADSWVLDPADGGMSWSSDPERRSHELLGQGTTDLRGEVRVHVPDLEHGLGLRVSGPAHLPLVRSDVRFPTEGPLEIVVASGGRVAGRVRVAGYAPGTLSLVFEPDVAQRTSYGDEPTAALDDQGTFRSPSLAPGPYLAYLQLETRYRREGGSSGTYMRLLPALASVTVGEGHTSELDLDASHLSAASVAGAVVLDGVPFGDCRALLLREEGSSRRRFGQFVPDPLGRFEADGLPPGTWRAGIVIGDYKTTQGDALLGDELFELAPGARVERVLAFERRRLVLRLLGADGVTALADVKVRLRIAGGHDRNLRTDEEGRLVLDPAPGGELRAFAGGLDSGPITPAPEREVELDVVLR